MFILSATPFCSRVSALVSCLAICLVSQKAINFSDRNSPALSDLTVFYLVLQEYHQLGENCGGLGFLLEEPNPDISAIVMYHDHEIIAPSL